MIEILKSIPAIVSLLKEALRYMEEQRVFKLENDLVKKSHELDRLVKELNSERRKVEINEQAIKDLHFKLRKHGIS
jgi:hypothetical protein